MFFTVEKLTANVKKLEKLRYRDARPIPWFEMSDPSDGRVGERPEEVVYTGEFRKGDFWSGRGDYVWIRQRVCVPQEWAGKQAAGYFNFGKTGGGYNSGFESLIYLDGVPYQEAGSWHEEVLLPKDCAGRTMELCFRMWAGLEGGGEPTVQYHQFQEAMLCILDETADDFYYSSRAVLETIKVLGENDPVRGALLMALDRSHHQIDWRVAQSDAFYGSLERALAVLKEEVGKIEYHTPVTVHTVGHSHIDVAWLWQLKHTREKAARTFSTMCTLMEQYPEFTFLQSQPQLYKYIKKDYPDIYARMKKAVAAGNWEPNGGMWVEADCNLSSGEALVRQLLHGRRFFKEEFGVVSNVLWLPDVFGYSWALPQILKKSGIDTFMTIKISWNQYNQMPHDTFWWRGLDGSEVLTHFMSTPAISDSGAYTYNGSIDPVSVAGAWKLYHDKEINQDLLLAYGHGDGGGGVNRDMLEMGRHLKAMPGLPRVEPGHAAAYFEKLGKTVRESDRFVHTWDGELYLEYHRGTYTSQAKNKRFNRKLELRLRELEWLWTAAAVKQKQFDAYPEAELHEAWEILLRNQFHDIIPGSSIHEVYEDSRAEYAEAFAILDSLEKRAFAILEEHENAGVGDGQQVTVINGGSVPCEELVYISDEAVSQKADGQWRSESGDVLSGVRVENGWLVETPAVRPLGFGMLTFAEGTGESERMQSIPWTGTVESAYYRICWNEKGQMTSIYDREHAREVLVAGQTGNRLVVYEDRPQRYDAWDIDLYYKEKYYEVEDLRSVSVEQSSLFTRVKMEWSYGTSTISQEIRLYEKNRRIDFITHVDWHEHQQLLRVLFPVDVRCFDATYDIQYGNVKRPTHQNTSWDMAKFETVAHQWADLSENGYGVSLMNDCKYGYSTEYHVLGMSLIKSGIYPDVSADQGSHDFTYSLYPHDGGWQDAGVQASAWALNNPLRVVPGRVSEMDSLCRTDCSHVAIDCVKKAEESDEVLIRVHEYTGKRAEVQLQTGFDAAWWQETNLMEEADGSRQTGAIAFEVKPYEIRTFKVHMKK